MCKWLCALCLLLQFSLRGEGWQTAMPISPGTSEGVNYDVCIAYNAANNTMVATFASDNFGDGNPLYYSVFDGANWTTATAFSSTRAIQNVEVVYYPKTKVIIAAWGGHSDNAAYYSIFDGTHWTQGNITLGDSIGVFQDVTLVYNESNNTVVAAWGDMCGTHFPYYSVYDGTNWSPGALINYQNISLEGTGVIDDVMLAYGNGKVMAAWGDQTSKAAFYNFFNGTSWLQYAANIDLNGSDGVQEDVSLVYNNNTFVAAWVNSGNVAGGTSLYYSILQNSTWNTGLIPNGASNGGYENIALLYNPDTDTIFAAWQDNEDFTNYPFYSIFEGGVWLPGAPIPLDTPNNGVDVNINLGFYPTKQTVVAVWANLNNTPYQNPYYSTFATPLLPPSDLTVQKRKNDFAVVEEYNNLLKWKASPSLSVVAYQIYRDNQRITRVPAQVLSYLDHNVKQKGTYTYAVTAVNSAGVESVPVISKKD